MHLRVEEHVESPQFFNIEVKGPCLSNPVQPALSVHVTRSNPKEISLLTTVENVKINKEPTNNV